MADLSRFIAERIEGCNNAKAASTAAEIREAFASCTDLSKKEIRLKLARKGFAEETANYFDGVRKTSKRVYRLRMNQETTLIRIKSDSTGGP